MNYLASYINNGEHECCTVEEADNHMSNSRFLQIYSYPPDVGYLEKEIGCYISEGYLSPCLRIYIED